jgi:hypothetical protein
MSNFYPDQGRTRVCGEVYVLYAADEKPAENAELGKKGHFWVDTVETIER